MTYGVVERTVRRRRQTTNDFLAFAGPSIPSHHDLFKWSRTLSDGTRLSYVTTVVAELRRRNTPITGDVKGVVRHIQKEAIGYRPTRAVPITPAQVRRLLATPMEEEIRTILVLMWKTASRLTSVTQLLMADVAVFDNIVRMTFRHGKTIIATGPYTLWAEVDDRTIAWLTSQPVRHNLFTRTADQLYRPIASILRPMGYEIRSFRRGALQTMAEAGCLPEDIILVSRHTTIKGLYTYLDHGAASRYEEQRITKLTQML